MHLRLLRLSTFCLLVHANASFAQESCWLGDFHNAHVEDLTFALNKLTELNQTLDERFAGHLDLDKVGAFGWSRGGATSFQASVDDARIKVAVNIDGTMFGRPIEQTGSMRPLLLLEGTDSYYDPLNDHEADPEIEELWASVEADWWGLFRRSTHDWYRGRIVGSSHTQFSDFPLASRSPSADAIAPQRVRDITNSVVLEFFDRYLKNTDDAPILSGWNPYPELRMVSEKPAP